MTELLIKYNGGTEELRISDIHPDGEIAINVFCHLRQARRTFKIELITQAVNAETGELVNPWKIISTELSQGEREPLGSLTWRVVPAIKALKFFTLTTRGFAQRERNRVVQFVQEVAEVTAYSKDEVSEWVYKLWCADMYAYRAGETAQYTELLRSIPSALLERCRDYALLIARGSGRKPLEPSWVERIETEFTHDPQVKRPVQQQDEAREM